jgi:ubiquitin carboxyl-terminal hydrolase 4/11/15
MLDLGSLNINDKNPLGMRGQLVSTFAALCRQLWFGVSSPVSPMPLKKAIGKFAPQFSGWQQQDSHELLMFLLDGIHEDLNHPSPDVPSPVVGDGTNDREVAAAAWHRHTARNCSFIVDHIHGQYRSQLTCPLCRKTSVVFDPFMSITLPIDKHSTNNVLIYFVPYEFALPPVPFVIAIPRDVAKITDNLILPQLFEQLGRTAAVALGCPSPTEGISWTIGTNAKVLFAFELPDEALTYVLCSVRMIGKRTTQLRDVSRFFVVGLGESAATRATLEPLIEGQLQSIWDPNPDLAVSPEVRKILDLTEFPSSKVVAFPEGAKFVAAIGRYTILTTNLRKDDRLKRSGSRRVFANWVSVVLNPRGSVCTARMSQWADIFAKPTVNSSMLDQVSLRECFEFMGECEQLDSGNRWLCPKCGQQVCAVKKGDLWRVGEIVIIQLKRFIRTGYRLRKLEAFVDFPERLNLREFIRGPQNESDQWYRLYAVSNHMGGLSGGHYTAHAIVQDPFGNGDTDAAWWAFNDSLVMPASRNSWRTPSAYVLFYEKITEC